MDNIDKVCYIIKMAPWKNWLTTTRSMYHQCQASVPNLPRWKVILCGSLLALLIAILVSRQYRKCRRLA